VKGDLLKVLAKRNAKLAKANKKLKLLANTDALTGLYNRCFFEEKIDGEMKCSDRNQDEFSMISFDVDHFKRVNDTWGHLAGDEVLKQTAAIAQGVVPRTAMLIRFGGDEFIVLLPHTPQSAAAEVAEVIRAAVEQSTFRGVGKITASFGVAERKRAEPFKFWYKRADAALYRAKNLGRNQVVLSRAETEQVIASVHIAWAEAWGCGDGEIDAQHKKLVELGQELLMLTLQPHLQQQNILQQLDRLVEHLVYHFACEEHLLTKVAYPQVQEHALIHKSLAAKVLVVKDSYRQGDIKASAFFSFLVDDVIVGHLQQEDVKFSPYIQRRCQG